MHFGLIILALSGCGIFNGVKETIDNVKETVNGLLNPLISQSMVLGVQESEDPLVVEALAGTDYEPGTAVSVFLADAANADDAENAPVEGAAVTIAGSAILDATEEGGGLYVVAPGPGGLAYIEDQIWRVEIDVFQDGESLSAIEVSLPPPAQVDVPPQHTAQQPLELDFTGQGFHAALVVVLDENGDITYTNEPETISDVIALTRGDDEITLHAVPSEAFPDEAIYAVGIAGMRHSDPSSIENMNTLASSAIAGKMRFYGVSTMELPTGLP